MQDRRWDAVIFDNDQTLVRSGWAIKSVWLRFALRYRVPFRPSVLKKCWGMSTDDIAELLLSTRRHPLTPGEVFDAADYVEGLERRSTFLLQAMPGAERALGAFAAHPERLAVASSGSGAVIRHRLRHCGLAIPDVIVSADDCDRGKPDPQCFQIAADRLGADARRCLVVEDSPNGIAAARALGCDVLAVLSTHYDHQLDADVVVRTLDDVDFHCDDHGVRLDVRR